MQGGDRAVAIVEIGQGGRGQRRHLALFLALENFVLGPRACQLTVAQGGDQYLTPRVSELQPLVRQPHGGQVQPLIDLGHALAAALAPPPAHARILKNVFDQRRRRPCIAHHLRTQRLAARAAQQGFEESLRARPAVVTNCAAIAHMTLQRGTGPKVAPPRSRLAVILARLDMS